MATGRHHQQTPSALVEDKAPTQATAAREAW